MQQFESPDQYLEFAEFVRTKSRHIRDDRNHRFLETVLETSSRRKELLATGTELWRAQLGFEVADSKALSVDTEELVDVKMGVPLKTERMKPETDRAYEGRVNPKGIPCLYCSTDPHTAMAEVRPWIGSEVSLARLVTVRDLTVVDCSQDPPWSPPWWDSAWRSGKRSSADECEKGNWGAINGAFSLPVSRSDDNRVADYAPTQVLAEAFRSYGYDGVVYRSALGGGKNVALFDLSAAEIICRQLHSVLRVYFVFQPRTPVYYIPGYEPEPFGSQKAELTTTRGGEGEKGTKSEIDKVGGEVQNVPPHSDL